MLLHLVLIRGSLAVKLAYCHFFLNRGEDTSLLELTPSPTTCIKQVLLLQEVVRTLGRGKTITDVTLFSDPQTENHFYFDSLNRKFVIINKWVLHLNLGLKSSLL